jgi:hypothetical protein
LHRIAAQKTGKRNHHWDTQTSVIQLHQFNFTRIYKYETERVDFFADVFGRIGFRKDWLLDRVQDKLNYSPSLDYSFDNDDYEIMCRVYAEDLENFSYLAKV